MRRHHAVYPEKKPLGALEGKAIELTLTHQIDLGNACGKTFRTSTMAILDAGDSDILSAEQA